MKKNDSQPATSNPRYFHNLPREYFIMLETNELAVAIPLNVQGIGQRLDEEITLIRDRAEPDPEMVALQIEVYAATGPGAKSLGEPVAKLRGQCSNEYYQDAIIPYNQWQNDRLQKEITK